jgi:hypothetical protein
LALTDIIEVETRVNKPDARQIFSLPEVRGSVTELIDKDHGSVSHEDCL